MAVLPAPPESGRTWSSHWYRVDGKPEYSQFTADGQKRATTLRDARKKGLLPSVTTILSVLGKPGLETWKQNQVLEAAHGSPASDGESIQSYTRRIKNQAFQQVDDAARIGSAIHDALDRYWDGHPVPPEWLPYVQPVLDWKQSHQIRFTEREIGVSNLTQGYAGRADVFLEVGSHKGAGDFKTRKTKPGVGIDSYPEQKMQLAAYIAAHYGEDALPASFAVNVYISTTEPGRVEIVQHTGEELVAAFDAFRGVCAIWRYQTGYDPRLESQLNL